MVNKCILIGNVGKDPEIINNGETKIANFSLATTEKYKDVSQTEWHNIVVWRGLAEVVEKYVKKGTLLYVEGMIKTEKWQDKEGKDRYTTKIHVGFNGTIRMIGKKETDQPQSTSEQKGDDLPFD